MCYCVTEGDIEMISHEWLDEWKIPTTPRTVPGQTTEGGSLQVETWPPQVPVPGQTTEGGSPQVETWPPQVPVPKKPRTGKIKSNQIEGGSEQLGTQKGRIETTQPTNEYQKPAEGAQETAMNLITQKLGGTKRLAVQKTGARKKSKSQ
jgi:hypothetical protein